MAYTNSPLVNYKKISPNKTINRNHKIDTITIHHMAGNLTVEQCGEVFAPKSRQASANYGIGSDGRIGLYVEEKDRSWATSSPDNDHRAITIEVANDNTKTWTISDKAYKSLVALCVDICKRNGITELKWKGDKKLVGKVEQQNMTVHRWFAATLCPGDYLYNLHSQIAKDVNAELKKTTATKLETGNDIIWELMNGKHKIKIDDVNRAVKALDKAKNNPEYMSLYWILYKAVNGND
jgi:hypothetical protein